MAVYRCTVKAHYVANNTLVEPGFYVKTDPAPLGSEPDPSDVATGIWDHIGAAWLATARNSVHFDELVLTEQVVPPAIGTAGAHTIDAAGTNSLDGTGIPFGLVAILNFHTAVRSRSARGHCALAPPSVSNALDGNAWSSSLVSSISTLRALLDDQLELGSVEPTQVTPCCYSRKRHLLGQNPYTFDVTTVSLNPAPHWLKSRMTAP